MCAEMCTFGAREGGKGRGGGRGGGATSAKMLIPDGSASDQYPPGAY